VADSAGGGEVIVTGAPTDAEAGVGTGGDAGVSSFSDGDVSTGAVPGVVEHATVVNATIATASVLNDRRRTTNHPRKAAPRTRA